MPAEFMWLRYYITLDVFMWLLTLDEGPSLEMLSFCLFFSGSNITTQHSKSVTLHIIGTTHTGTDSFSMFTEQLNNLLMGRQNLFVDISVCQLQMTPFICND